MPAWSFGSTRSYDLAIPLRRLRRRTNEKLYGSDESFLERIRTGDVALDELRARSGPYPTELVRDCKRALVLFGAAFLGVHDVIHFSNAGTPDVTVVDIDGEKLTTMRALYPATWEFVEADAFAFVDEQRRTGALYDIVSADPYTPHMPQTLALAPALCELARHAVLLGVEHGAPFKPTPGWRGRRIERWDTIDWIVFEPATEPVRS